jgi:integrase
LKPFFGFMSVGRINALLIEKDFKAELPRDLSSKTKRNILMVLRTLLRTAVTWGYLRSNPFDPRNQRCVTLPEYVREQKGRALTPEESNRLLEACVDPDTFAMVATGLLSGMRIGELLALQPLNVDRKDNKIHVRQQLYWRHGDFWGENTGYVFRKPKSKASIRDIDLSPRLKAILLDYLAGTRPKGLDLVFTNSQGNPINPSNFLGRQFKPAVEAAGLRDLRFHDLRHTFGSMLIAQGQDLKYVQTQLGHSSIQVTVDVYGHLLKKSNPDAVARLDEMIFGAGTKTPSETRD